MTADFYFALTITAPIFTILGLGIVFKRIGLMTDAFAKVGADLVFKVTLPCLLFVKLVETDFRHNLPYLLVIYAVIATIVVFIVLDRLIARWIAIPDNRGVFVQGAFRGNMGIIGLAFCLSAFGDTVIAVASIYLAVLTTLYNILSVITLTRHHYQPVNSSGKWRVLLEIGKNPLIIAIAIGVVVSLSRIPVPALLLTTGEYFARMTLPLALLCAGASIRLLEFKGDRALYWASAGKLLFVPLVITTGGVLIGLRGQDLGVLYLMSTSPTAAASYPMALALGGNHHLAAAIIAMTSLGAVFFVTVGVFVLRSLALI
ncbi:MAG: AEC family transporter [Pelovirga sp.]